MIWCIIMISSSTAVALCFELEADISIILRLSWLDRKEELTLPHNPDMSAVLQSFASPVTGRSAF
jgi:hypothetical protein